MDNGQRHLHFFRESMYPLAPVDSTHDGDVLLSDPSLQNKDLMSFNEEANLERMLGDLYETRARLRTRLRNLLETEEEWKDIPHQDFSKHDLKQLLHGQAEDVEKRRDIAKALEDVQYEINTVWLRLQLLRQSPEAG